MTTQSTGVRHARITRSMIMNLSNGARLVVEGLRWALLENTPTLMSQAEIAKVANVSESTVNRVISEIEAAGIITLERVARTDVRGIRWRVTLHSPPEVVEAGGWYGDARAGSVADDEGSTLHEAPVAPAEPVPTPQMPVGEGSANDQHEDHDQYKQQQHDPTPTAPALSPDQQLLYAALRAHPTINHKTAMRLIALHPTRTPDEFAADLATACRRPNVPSPLGLVLHCWLNGEALYSPTPPRKETAPPPEKGTTDGTHQPQRPAARPAHARTPQRERGHDQIPVDFGFDEFFAFAEQFADSGGGGDVSAV